MIAVTGANGFIGRSLCAEATVRGVAVRALIRRSGPVVGADDVRVVGNLATDRLDPDLLDGVDCVIHCAGRAHRSERDAGAEDAYLRDNRDATRALARAAASAGVRRFVYVSTVKVLGECTPPGVPFTDLSLPDPQDAYARSKAMAEDVLLATAQGVPMDVVIVRPPLVHGPGAAGNMRLLLRLLRRGVPLPFGAVSNRRAVVGIDNLVDFILTAAASHGVHNDAYLLRDEAVLSTPAIIRALAQGAHAHARLVAVPSRLLRHAMKAAGQRRLISRLIDDLDVVSGRAEQVFGWSPKVGVVEGLVRTGAAGLQ